MRLLLDTNIFLEIILEQEKAAEAKALLTRSREHEFFITDYSLHSIGLLLFRRKAHDAFRRFLADMIMNVGTEIISLPPESMESLITAALNFNLDFDDAYQYTAAERHDLTLVSFDGDFDHTERGRSAPAQILGG